jgi:hypothetical protein
VTVADPRGDGQGRRTPGESDRRRNRALAGTAAVALLLSGGLLALFAFTPDAPVATNAEGRPLLASDGAEFYDAQLGLRFTPPPGWFMQVRSTETPTAHRADRTLVKYKRFAKGPKVAWMRVSVVDTPGDSAPLEFVKDRKPREAHWTVTKGVEGGLTVGGRPAARITYGGAFNPDRQGNRPGTTEIIGVRHGARALYFAGTFSTADSEARDQFRAAVEGVCFDSK